MAKPNAAAIAKAVKNENKSEGMRQLLQAGMTVAEVKEAFGAAYGFVYGVAVRAANAGLINLADVVEGTGARQPKAKAPAKAKAKATAKPAPRAVKATKAKGRAKAKA